MTDNFKINSGNSGTKRKREEAHTNNFRTKMMPLSLDFNRKQSPLSSPISTPKRRVLGEIQNSPLFRPKDSPTIERLKNTPIIDKKSPLIDRNSLSPLTSRTDRSKRPSKISRIFEERSKFKMSDKENDTSLMSETFLKIDVDEETRDCSFGDNFPSCSATKLANWSVAKLDFKDALQTCGMDKTDDVKENIDMFVPEKEVDIETDFETLHDLEEEFESRNFDECTKYEIISTDSPNIISSGRTTSRKINSKNFEFGAPLSENEQSTSFNKPTTNATRMLNFEDDNFEFTSPAAAAKRPSHSVSVKKSLKFTETPTKNALQHEKSDSSIGSMASPSSTQLRIYPSGSTTSMESGFISGLEEPFLDIDEVSNSPRMANFNELLSGHIRDSFESEFTLRRQLQRSLSLNPEATKARVSLFPINESPKKSNKRGDRNDIDNISNKRRKSNCESPKMEKLQRPVLQRALSENNASIMSALARSVVDPDLIGDFSLPFALPLTSGDHTDLKSISCDTLASLIRGDYHESINDFQVIDCRYPYEFEGGHILGAMNLFTPAQILTLVNKPLQPKDSDKRSILVFHCEFSLERGPKLSRFLRSSDRAKNKENYPSLHYPEVYLLHEGYRAFYQRYPDLCSPTGYTAMLDPQHRDLLRKHRSVQQPSSSMHHRRSVQQPSSSMQHRRSRLLL
ncbi:M-phase inducer phosphatase 3-like isoform X2 [Nymphalis io]|nr:M-phase inducer phosphatase 3-like isoform X2 [Nymphalis io]XP_050360079.1 M-phase inducer phosphatase 3-like isoform X2 [Nymphalis io]